MKMILIAVVALLVLGGGGGAAYFFLFATPAEAAIDENGNPIEVEKKVEEEHIDYKFVELEPLILPIVDDNGVSQTVSLVVVLEVMSEEIAGEVEHLKPRIKDAFIQDMYGMLNRHAALKGGVIQVNYLKQRLNKISHKVIGEDKVHDVLLQVVHQRPI